MTGIETIRDCLGQIDPARCDYEQWLKIGCAIKHEGGTVEEWDRWSRKDPRYKPKDCVSRWDNLGKGHAPVTVATVCQICSSMGGSPPRSEYDNGISPDSEIDMDAPFTYREHHSIIRKEWLEIEPMPSPDESRTPSQELAVYLRALFQSDECVGYVTDAIHTEPGADGVRRWVPAGKGIYSESCGQMLNSLNANPTDLGAVVGDWQPECGAWIRFNPLDGKGVSDANVTDYRFALVESDDIPIDEQWTIIRKLELPVAALVHSGGKSLHAIVRIEAVDYKEYQHRVDQLYDICKRNGLSIDRKNRNPSRLSRMPGVTRNGNRQSLVAVNIGKSSWSEWIDWVSDQVDDLPDITGMAEVWANPPPLRDSLIEGLLRCGHKMLISGPSKAGKSYLLMELMIAIAEGRKWLNWECRQGRVLYVNLELDPASCDHRVIDMYRAFGITIPHLENIDIWHLRGKSVPLDKLAPKLIRKAAKKKYSAIIIDPIYKVITGDENSADQMAAFCNQFDKICAELNCAVIYCHHHSKGTQGQKATQDRASGSGVFARDPDALIDLVELDFPQECRQQASYQFQVKALTAMLDSECPGWEEHAAEGFDEDKLDDVLSLARQLRPDRADKINGEEISIVRQMTPWRITGILREFPTFAPVNTFFRYPVHVIGATVDAMLCDRKAVGEYVPMTRAERAQAGKSAGEEKKAKSINRTRMAFDALDDGNPITTNRVANYLGISEQQARTNLKKAGFKTPEGVTGLWIRPEK